MKDTRRILPIILWLLLAAAITIVACSIPSPPQTPTPRPTHTPWPTGVFNRNNEGDIRVIENLYPTPTMTPLPLQTFVPPDVRDPVPMVPVPAGPFLMGSTPDQIKLIRAMDEQYCDRIGMPSSVCGNPGLWVEVPQRVVNVAEFYIDQREVTNAQYRRCVEAGVCPDIPEDIVERVNQKRQRLHDSAYDRYPANVPWAGAEAYCRWVGKRLPTEAEWEKAARGVDGRAYPWGNKWDPYKMNVDRDEEPVGSYPEGASPYGVLDMAGNAWEWVADRFALYPGAEAFIPEGLLDRFSRLDTHRILRGISSAVFYETRISMRWSFYPEAADRLFGFRCAYSP